MTDEEFEEIKKRERLASKGPWKAEYGWDNGGILFIPEHNQNQSVEMLVDDAFFIAHAREDIPKLIKEVEHLRRVLKATEYPG